MRLFVSYYLHKCRLVSVIHRINAAFGVSSKFVPYRPPYDDLISKGLTKTEQGVTTFTIDRDTHPYLLVIFRQISQTECEYKHYIVIKYSNATNVFLTLLSKSADADTHIQVTSSGNVVSIDTSTGWKLASLTQLA